MGVKSSTRVEGDERTSLVEKAVVKYKIRHVSVFSFVELDKSHCFECMCVSFWIPKTLLTSAKRPDGPSSRLLSSLHVKYASFRCVDKIYALISRDAHLELTLIPPFPYLRNWRHSVVSDHYKHGYVVIKTKPSAHDKKKNDKTIGKHLECFKLLLFLFFPSVSATYPLVSLMSYFPMVAI